MMFAALAAALALVPTGFTENAVLNVKAAYIAGKPVHVYCATTEAAWSAYVDSSGATVTDAQGLTPIIGGTETFLSPEACTPLLRRLRGHLPFPLAFGGGMDILTHEGFHLSGISDEGQTECSAYHALPHYLTSTWGFKKGGPAYTRVLSGATNYHRSLPPQYRTVC